MDVVRRNIEALRGRIHIESEVGRGSTFTIELPLTLAIIDGMEVQLGTERFIIPTLSILEFVKPSPDMITTPLDRVEMLQFRGSFLPLFRLAALYGIEPLAGTVEEGIIVVVESNGNQVAILLDAVVGTYSTVIKSLGPTFEGIRGLAGCAIMPDGGIGLILDIGTLVDLARSTRVEPTRLPTPSPVAMSMEVH